MHEKNLLGFYSFGLLFLSASFSIGNLIERDQSVPLLVSYLVMFISYLFLLQRKDQETTIFLLGLFARLVLFFSLPTLSDDIYRFIWDGTLLNNGIHPFAALPSFYLEHPVEGLSTELYDQLNSPEYFTIYPPFNQVLFWLSVKLGGGWLLSTNFLRTVLLLADVGSFFLIRKLLVHFQKDPHLAFWYLLNPLVVLELTGNLHFEGLVVFFLLLGIYGYKRSKSLISVTGLGLAIAAKLLPLINLPFLFFVGLKNKRWWIAIAAALVGLLTLVPLLNDTFINGMSSSLDLYFRKFEFNASLYFLAREVGYWKYGYNNIAKIGPLLSIFSLTAILITSGIAAYKKWSLPSTFMFILCLYLLFSTVIHPWYIIPLIAFGILSGFWFPLLWSLMIFLTYMGYSASGYELPIWFIVLEYVSVLSFAGYEIRNLQVK